jgi:hypothetical protein
MPRWLWFMPLAVITVIAALWGFRLGWVAATLTETEVITRYAQRYLEDRARDDAAGSASIADCVAYPGKTPGIWLVVSCTPRPAGAVRYEYAVNRFGGLEQARGPDSGDPTSKIGRDRPET